LTFPYQNPEQNPAQGRPRFSLSFKVTPGAAVLPPPPEQQLQANVRRLPPQLELVSTPRFTAVGERVTVRGEGLTPGKAYALNWSRYSGSRVSGLGFGEGSVPLAEATADAAGRIAFSFKTPDDLGGAHGVWIDIGGGLKKTGAQ
jgi:hypothetical protein